MWINSLIVRVLDYQSRGSGCKATKWLQGQLSFLYFQGKPNYYQIILGTWWLKVNYFFWLALQSWSSWILLTKSNTWVFLKNFMDRACLCENQWKWCSFSKIKINFLCITMIASSIWNGMTFCFKTYKSFLKCSFTSLAVI